MEEMMKREKFCIKKKKGYNKSMSAKKSIILNSVHIILRNLRA